jgi:ABC-type multidrug transport system permease subunit
MNEDKSLQNNILDKIKKDEVKMTPKQFFVMKWVTMFVTSVFFLVLGAYIFAFIVFLFVDNGLVYIPLLSESGLVDFIVEVPWTLVFLGVLSVFLFHLVLFCNLPLNP